MFDCDYIVVSAAFRYVDGLLVRNSGGVGFAVALRSDVRYPCIGFEGGPKDSVSVPMLVDDDLAGIAEAASGDMIPVALGVSMMASLDDDLVCGSEPGSSEFELTGGC